jgi:uncharacterized protein (DUF1810 family)
MLGVGQALERGLGRVLINSFMSASLRRAGRILGSPDNMKFRSCLTLFHQAASEDSDRALFRAALNQFYRGEADARTLELLS